MPAAPNHALIRALPDRLGVMRREVEAHAPRGPGAEPVRTLLVGALVGAEFLAHGLAAFVPLAGPAGSAPRQVQVPLAGHVPTGWPEGEAVEPLVPRREPPAHPRAPHLPG